MSQSIDDCTWALPFKNNLTGSSLIFIKCISCSPKWFSGSLYLFHLTDCLIFHLFIYFFLFLASLISHLSLYSFGMIEAIHISTYLCKFQAYEARRLFLKTMNDSSHKNAQSYLWAQTLGIFFLHWHCSRNRKKLTIIWNQARCVITGLINWI